MTQDISKSGMLIGANILIFKMLCGFLHLVNVPNPNTLQTLSRFLHDLHHVMSFIPYVHHGVGCWFH